MKENNTKLQWRIPGSHLVFPLILLILMGSAGVVTALVREGPGFQITDEEFNGGNSTSRNKFLENQSAIGLFSSFNTLDFTFPPNQGYQNPANVLSGGGNASTSGHYQALSTIGQLGFVGIHSLPDSRQEIHQGFWPMVISTTLCSDLDRDGYFGLPDCGTKVDCDDNNAAINPGAAEVCDGIDNNCDGAVDEGCTATEIIISLNTGWNLISTSLAPVDTTIDNVLWGISDSCNSVWAFNNGWTAYYPANPGYSDLQMMDAGWGYWLNMKAPATLTVTGTVPSKTVSLVQGWNLVGYNSPDPLPIADAIGSIKQNCESVWAYIDGRWKAYYPAYPGYSDLETMEPNYGYWIKTTQPCTWTLP